MFSKKIFELSTMQSVFSQSQLDELLNHPEVLSAKSRLVKQVYFNIELTGAQKQALNQSFGLSLDRVPMRWIKGDTPSHIDNGTNESHNYSHNSHTNLVFL